MPDLSYPRGDSRKICANVYVKLFPMAKPHGGYSRTACTRRKNAAALSQQMRHGDSDAALRLLQRRRALQGIAKCGGHRRVQLMNQARLAKRGQVTFAHISQYL
jgi:hypothetical protein